MSRPTESDPFAPWGLVGFINMKMAFVPSPFTPGDYAAEAARNAPDFHTLPQAERDQRVRDAIEAASW